MTIHHWFYTFLSSTVFVFVIGITNTGNANRLETEAAMNLVAEEELNEQDPWSRSTIRSSRLTARPTASF